MNFEQARATMIESQVRTNDVSDLALQSAMRKVAREGFVVEDRRAFAYAEVTCPTPSGRELWKPRDFAKLAQAAQILAGDTILVVAGAGGYSAAVFAAMGCDVTVLDTEACAIDGVKSVVGALDQPPRGDFDVVFVDGAVEVIPEAWGQALRVGGKLCVIVQSGHMGEAKLGVKSGDGLALRTIFNAVVPKLSGFEAAPAFTF
jgi:protein-L-isoaspartate(D-aspartate) O-methyltransferase